MGLIYTYPQKGSEVNPCVIIEHMRHSMQQIVCSAFFLVALPRPDGQPMSKKALKKQQKEAEKAAKKQERKQQVRYDWILCTMNDIASAVWLL